MANYKKKLVDVTAADIPGVLPEKWVEGGRGGRDEVRGPLSTKNPHAIYDQNLQ